jgi:hypothetical protein
MLVVSVLHVNTSGIVHHSHPGVPLHSLFELFISCHPQLHSWQHPHGRVSKGGGSGGERRPSTAAVLVMADALKTVSCSYEIVPPMPEPGLQRLGKRGRQHPACCAASLLLRLARGLHDATQQCGSAKRAVVAGRAMPPAGACEAPAQQAVRSFRETGLLRTTTAPGKANLNASNPPCLRRAQGPAAVPRTDDVSYEAGRFQGARWTSASMLVVRRTWSALIEQPTLRAGGLLRHRWCLQTIRLHDHNMLMSSCVWQGGG